MKMFKRKAQLLSTTIDAWTVVEAIIGGIILVIGFVTIVLMLLQQIYLLQSRRGKAKSFIAIFIHLGIANLLILICGAGPLNISFWYPENSPSTTECKALIFLDDTCTCFSYYAIFILLCAILLHKAGIDDETLLNIALFTCTGIWIISAGVGYPQLVAVEAKQENGNQTFCELIIPKAQINVTFAITSFVQSLSFILAAALRCSITSNFDLDKDSDYSTSSDDDLSDDEFEKKVVNETTSLMEKGIYDPYQNIFRVFSVHMITAFPLFMFSFLAEFDLFSEGFLSMYSWLCFLYYAGLIWISILIMYI